MNPIGCVDLGVDRIAGLGSSRNASRNLHNFVHREGKTFPVPVSTCPLRIRRMNKLGGEINVQYPILKLTDWMRSLLVEDGGAPEFLLGGHMLFQCDRFKAMFTRFWQRYRSADPSHVAYEKTDHQLVTTIPISIHGDEGRGLGKVPVLVESYQPVIPYMGENVLNVKGFLGK